MRPIGRSPQIGRAAENFDDLVPQKAIFKSKKYPPSMSPFGPKLAYLLSCTRIHLQISIIPLCCCIIPIQNLRPKASDPQGVRLLPPVEVDGSARRAGSAHNVICRHGACNFKCESRENALESADSEHRSVISASIRVCSSQQALFI